MKYLYSLVFLIGLFLAGIALKKVSDNADKVWSSQACKVLESKGQTCN